MKYTKIFSLFILLWTATVAVSAQEADYSKMSPFVREAAMYTDKQSNKAKTASPNKISGPTMCAFVKMKDGAEKVFKRYGCRILAQFGDIYIADIPLHYLPTLSLNKEIERIEAGRVKTLCLDTTLVVVDAIKAQNGTELQQTYDGNGVVLGMMDVGFDLTHPDFRDTRQTRLRISRFWDQLSPDSLGSSLYVGADYRTEAEILSYAHSLDGYVETHGTHTLGIATGTGYDTMYHGMAPGADICLVSNAVNTDIPLIPEHMLYKYTTATDALGFKYIFDYADEVDKPCVISFSEGSTETFDGEQQLFYEVLSRMTGPGHIIVASAGNCGYYNNYLHKTNGKHFDGIFMECGEQKGSLTILSADDFAMEIALSPDNGTGRVSKTIKSYDILQSEDSLFVDSMNIGEVKCSFQIQAYRSCLPSQQLAYDLVVDMPGGVGKRMPLSLGITGDDADVKLYGNTIWFFPGKDDSAYSGGESKCCILSPGAASSVICVGASSYRDSYTDIYGQNHIEPWGSGGVIASYSSTGPTRYGLVKPDVVAPGSCVRSAYSSYYMEANPKVGQQLCSSSEFRGRLYGWGILSGTSQSTPVVSGAIALWLQANPNLTPADILDVFSKTCTRPNASYYNGKSNICGFGEIDVYAGLLRVLGLDGIKELSHIHPAKLKIINLGNGTILLSSYDNDTAIDKVRLLVYNINGERVYDTPVSLKSGTARVSLQHIPDGVYAVQVASEKKDYSGSLLIRK